MKHCGACGHPGFLHAIRRDKKAGLFSHCWICHPMCRNLTDRYISILMSKLEVMS